MTYTKMILQARQLRQSIVECDDTNEQRQLWRNLLDLFEYGPVGIRNYEISWADSVYVEKTIADLDHSGFGFGF